MNLTMHAKRKKAHAQHCTDGYLNLPWHPNSVASLPPPPTKVEAEFSQARLEGGSLERHPHPHIVQGEFQARAETRANGRAGGQAGM